MSSLIQIAKDRIEDYNHSLEWSSDTTSAGVQQMQKAKETTANYNVLPEEEESVHHWQSSAFDFISSWSHATVTLLFPLV